MRKFKEEPLMMTITERLPQMIESAFPTAEVDCGLTARESGDFYGTPEYSKFIAAIIRVGVKANKVAHNYYITFRNKKNPQTHNFDIPSSVEFGYSESKKFKSIKKIHFADIFSVNLQSKDWSEELNKDFSLTKSIGEDIIEHLKHQGVSVI